MTRVCVACVRMSGSTETVDARGLVDALMVAKDLADAMKLRPQELTNEKFIELMMEAAADQKQDMGTCMCPCACRVRDCAASSSASST